MKHTRWEVRGFEHLEHVGVDEHAGDAESERSAGCEGLHSDGEKDEVQAGDEVGQEGKGRDGSWD